MEPHARTKKGTEKKKAQFPESGLFGVRLLKVLSDSFFQAYPLRLGDKIAFYLLRLDLPKANHHPGKQVGQLIAVQALNVDFIHEKSILRKMGWSTLIKAITLSL
jgi:hypothetical protein